MRRRCGDWICQETSRTSAGDHHFLDLLALCSKYDLAEQIEALVPRAAQLAPKDLLAYHDRISVRILAAIYQAKMLKYHEIVGGIPESKNHQRCDIVFDERKPPRPCHVGRCNSVFTSFCRKCSFWFCPNHMHGCAALDEYQKCHQCGALVGFNRVGDFVGTDRCACTYTFSQDLLKKTV